MAQFMKRPTVVEAFQMTQDAINNPSSWPEWLRSAWSDMLLADSETKDDIVFDTLDGFLKVKIDDWLVLEINGDLQSYRPDLFRKMYMQISS